MFNKVYVEITNICNMHCSFCHGHSRTPRTMNEEEFVCILNRLKGYTNYIYYHLMGEPLIHPQLPHFIALANARGYKSILTTNGTLLQTRQEELLNAGLHKINISIHSFEEGDPEDHARYVSGVADFAKRAADMGTIVVFRLWNKGFDNDKNQTAMALLKQYIPGDWVKNTRGIRIRDKMFLELGERFQWPDIHAETTGYRFSCQGLTHQIGILADGTVVPCCLDSDGIINLGNIFQEDLETILSSKRATDIVKGFQCKHAVEDLCKRCSFVQRFL